MKKKIKIILPLFVMLPRKTKADKRFTLNLNTYITFHHRTVANAKLEYAKLVDEAVKEVYKFDKCEVEFKYFRKDKRRSDKSNPCCIIEKFACDRLTTLGFWDDDDSEHIPITKYIWGGVDKENPRCELTIREI